MQYMWRKKTRITPIKLSFLRVIDWIKVFVPNENAIGYVRRPYNALEVGSLWLHILEPKIGGVLYKIHKWAILGEIYADKGTSKSFMVLCVQSMMVAILPQYLKYWLNEVIFVHSDNILTNNIIQHFVTDLKLTDLMHHPYRQRYILLLALENWTSCRICFSSKIFWVYMWLPVNQ